MSRKGEEDTGQKHGIGEGEDFAYRCLKFWRPTWLFPLHIMSQKGKHGHWTMGIHRNMEFCLSLLFLCYAFSSEGINEWKKGWGRRDTETEVCLSPESLPSFFSSHNEWKRGTWTLDIHVELRRGKILHIVASSSGGRPDFSLFFTQWVKKRRTGRKTDKGGGLLLLIVIVSLLCCSLKAG